MGAFLKKSPQAPKKLLSRDLLMGLANGDEIIRDTNEPMNNPSQYASLLLSFKESRRSPPKNFCQRVNFRGCTDRDEIIQDTKNP